MIARSVFVLLLLTACGGTLYAQGSVSLDHVDGLDGSGNIIAGQPITFHIRFTNNSGLGTVFGVSHGFQFSSPAGSIWGPLSYAPTSAMIGCFDQIILDEQIPGRVSCLGVYTGSPFKTGLEEGFDAVVLTITTTFDVSQVGETVCIDAAPYNDINPWQWSWPEYPPLDLPPSWSGPHCYEIISLSNAAPTFLNCPLSGQTVNHENTWFYDLDATDSESDVISYSILSTGTGSGIASIDPNTGEFSYDPSILDADETITFVICASDPYNACPTGEECSFQVAVVTQNTIHGYVRQDHVYNDPIEGVTITARDEGVVVETATTDATGYYSMVVPDGYYTIDVTKSPYETEYSAVGVSNSYVAEMDFNLLASEYANLDISIELIPAMFDSSAAGTTTEEIMIWARIINGENADPYNITVGYYTIDDIPNTLELAVDPLTTDTVPPEWFAVPASWENKTIRAEIIVVDDWYATLTGSSSASATMSVAYLKTDRPYSIDIDAYSFTNPDDETIIKWFLARNPGLAKIYKVSPIRAFTYGGVCFGMSATSLVFFKDPDSRPDGYENSLTIDLPEGVQPVWEKLALYHLKQMIEPETTPVATAFGSTLYDLISEGSLSVLKLRLDNTGHAVAPYKVIHATHLDEYYFSIYENINSGDLASAYQQVHMNSATGVISYPGKAWNEFALVENVQSTSIGEVSKALGSTLWNSAKDMSTFLYRRLSLDCPVHPLIVDDYGHRLGFVDANTWVEEIPGAQYAIQATGDGDSAYYFDLPWSSEYTVTFEATGNGYANLFSYYPQTDSTGSTAHIDSLPVSAGDEGNLSLINTGDYISSVSTTGGTFDFAFNLPPGPAYLVLPPDSGTVAGDPTFVWGRSLDLDLDDSLQYDLVLATSPDFSDSTVYPAGSDTTLSVSGLTIPGQYYWRVWSTDAEQQATISIETRLVNLSDGCCGVFTGGITGNANCSEDGKLTLSDISRMIDRVYISKAVLCCEAGGNTNASTDCLITLSDISRLIDAVYISKTPPEPCLPDCET